MLEAVEAEMINQRKAIVDKQMTRFEKLKDESLEARE